MHLSDRIHSKQWFHIVLLGCTLSFPNHNILVHAQSIEVLSVSTNSSKMGSSQTSSNTAPLGTPLSWLQSNGYSNNYAVAELADPDSDGSLNWMEYVAGTNPKQSNSVFRIASLLITSNGGILNFPTQTNRFYQVEYSESLNGWQPLGESVQGDGKVASINNTLIANSRYYRISVTNTGDPWPSITNSMVWIKPGKFTMGSPISELDRNFSEVQHSVTISQGFYMKKYEVTQAEFFSVMGYQPSAFTGTNLPVENVSWLDATNYCYKLNEKERKSGRLPKGYKYTLPTEAQWEYACRAGTTNATSYGTNLSATAANFDGNNPYNGAAIGDFLGRTTSVGTYKANAWGLFDMHGNVLEWCADWYGSYPSTDVTDPMGPASGSERVLRGGSWFSYGRICRSAYRGSDSPSTKKNTTGFRTILIQAQ